MVEKLEKVDKNDVPLDRLVFRAELDGVAAPCRAGYAPLHPELYRYDESFLDPLVRTGDGDRFIHEDAEQIYRWQFFTLERVYVEIVRRHLEPIG